MPVQAGPLATAIVVRPGGGFVIRPSIGLLVRPDTGTVTRPTQTQPPVPPGPIYVQ